MQLVNAQAVPFEAGVQIAASPAGRREQKHNELCVEARQADGSYESPGERLITFICGNDMRALNRPVAVDRRCQGLRRL